MKLKDLSQEELETMSYDDIAYNILKENGKKLKLPELFKKVCNLLKLNDEEYEEKISDFFQLISQDQRFTMLDKGFWDLKEKHQTKVVIDTEEEDMEQEIAEDEEEDEEETVNHEDDTYYDEDSKEDDNGDDDLKDLVIISDDEDDEANAN